MGDVGCVSEAELRALVVGELPERVARLITVHLEGCPDCEATARRLDSLADPFLNSLREAVHLSSMSSGRIETGRPGTSSATSAIVLPEAENSRDTFPDFASARQKLDDPLPRGLPGYEIHGELGRGGMGVVYRARQLRLERVVALKMLLYGAHTSTERRVRFQAEADAIARLHHPNIVQVYDVGEHEGVPFLVLEYMRGGSLEKRLSGKPLTPRQAAELIETLAWAVDHAHGHGIIHRDLKPANILISGEGRGAKGERDEAENLRLASFIPKISDFGLAKQERAELTSVGDVLGTPSYMAPEQATGAVGAIGPAADIYALGAILYELLTRRPPFVSASVLETLEQVRTREPIAPGKLTTGMPHDLETICLKCLEKEAGKRYAGARALAEDLRRYLDGRPVLARPIGALGRTWRWARRNPGWAAMIASLAGLLLISAVGGTALSLWALRAEGQTREKLFESRVSEARALSLSRRPGQRFGSLALLDEAGQLAKMLRLPGERLDEVRNGALAALAMPDLYPEKTWPGFPEGSTYVDIDDGLAIYARTDRNGCCTLRRVADDREILSLQDSTEAGQENWPFLSRDARFLAVRQANGRLQVWQIDLDRPRKLLTAEEVVWVDFHPRLAQVAVAHGNGAIDLHDLSSGEKTSLPPDELSHDVSIALHPSEPLVAVASYLARVVKIRDFRTGEVIKSLDMPSSSGFSIAWHPKGHTLGVSGGGAIRLFDRATFACRLTFAANGGGGERLYFNHAGDRLATYGWNSAVQLYDVASGQMVFRVPNARPIFALRFDRADRWLAGFIEGNRLGIWQLADGREYRTLVRRSVAGDGIYLSASLSPDSKLLAVSMADGVGLWDVDSGQELEFLPLKRPRFAHFESAPHSALLIGDESGTFRWPIHSDPARPGLELIGPPEAVVLPAGSPPGQSRDGRVLATACRAVGTFEPWAGGWVLHAEHPDAPVHMAAGTDLWNLAVSPDGRWLVTGQQLTGRIQLWDAATGEFQRTLAGEGASPQFSPDGHWLSVGGKQGRLIEVGTWQDGIKLGNAARFAPDGHMMAVWTDTAAIRLVETATGRELARLEDPDFEVAHEVLFTPDGSRLITVHPSKGMHVWDLRLLREELAQRGLDWDAPPPMSALPRAESPHVQWVRGDYERLRDLQEAANYDLAVRAAPTLSQRWFLRAIYRQRAGLHEQAIADFRKALELRPNDPMLCNELAWLLCTGPENTRNPSDAVKLAANATTRQPGEWSFHNTLGIALYRAGRLTEAMNELKISLKGSAGHTDGFDLYFLAMACFRQGNLDAAQSYFSRAVAWQREHSNLPAGQIRELDAFGAEAARTLGLPEKPVRPKP
ncbi:MAG TPA: protein kinase [Gemmataceae bacterium]|nr:protein kinase [Gemmataceae bacterium]